jgi:hypothetical protein
MLTAGGFGFILPMLEQNEIHFHLNPILLNPTLALSRYGEII